MKGRWRGWGEQIPEIAVLSLPVTQEALSKAFSSSFLFLFFPLPLPSLLLLLLFITTF